MKRLIPITFLALLVFALSACNLSNIGTISVVELSERENAILSTTSEYSFVFDFKNNSEYEEGAVWIEKYEAGKLVEDRLSHVTTQVEQSGTIILAATTNNAKQKTFNIGIGSNGGVSSLKGIDRNLTDLDNMASVWGSFQGEKKLNEGEVLLGSICFSSNEIRSFTLDFYEDFEGHMDELNICDVAYLLKAEFIK